MVHRRHEREFVELNIFTMNRTNSSAHSISGCENVYDRVEIPNIVANAVDVFVCIWFLFFMRKAFGAWVQTAKIYYNFLLLILVNNIFGKLVWISSIFKIRKMFCLSGDFDFLCSCLGFVNIGSAFAHYILSMLFLFELYTVLRTSKFPRWWIKCNRMKWYLSFVCVIILINQTTLGILYGFGKNKLGCFLKAKARPLATNDMSLDEEIAIGWILPFSTLGCIYLLINTGHMFKSFYAGERISAIVQGGTMSPKRRQRRLYCKLLIFPIVVLVPRYFSTILVFFMEGKFLKSVFLQALFELTSDASGLLICLYTCLLSKEVRRIFRHFFFTEKWCKCKLERLQNDVKDENLLMTIKAENEDINPIIEVLGKQ